VTKFIAVSNRRGGVGKTTVSTMLAYGLGVVGRQKVLVVDLDAQASTSMVMMGHQRWHKAREAGHTSAGLLTQLLSEGGVNWSNYVTRGVGDVFIAKGTSPTIDIIPSSHDLDDQEALLMIAQQAQHHKISAIFDNMQSRMAQIMRSAQGAYDQVIIDCAPGLSQVVWGALRAADLVVIPYIPDRTAEDNVGWFAKRLEAFSGNFRTLPNRVSGQDSRAQGIIAAIGARFRPLGMQVPATQALATALDYREQPGTLATKFGAAAQHVNALTDAVLNVINRPVGMAAE
jgi:cellulose biosynthesis protein BcsQ